MSRGGYHIIAFEDSNRNLVYDKGEAAGQYRRSETLDVPAGGVVAEVDIALSRENNADLDFPAGSAVAPRNGPLHFTSPGVVVDLDEPFFSSEMGARAYWEHLEFYREYGGNIYFLEEYSPKKIPLLFVHGAGGSSSEWRVIAENIDRRKYQPWFYYYPSGASIEAMSHLLLWKVLNLQRKYQFSKLYITAHSMGGLVVRSFLVNFVRNVSIKIKFISISTPWGGDDLAALGVKYMPAVIPSWNEIRSDGHFIESLYEKKLPENVEHYLFFSYRGDGNPFRQSNDRVVTLQSELDCRAQTEARKDFFHDGIFYFFNLPKGEYKLSIKARGYRPYSAMCKVEPGQNYNLMNVALQRRFAGFEHDNR